MKIIYKNDIASKINDILDTIGERKVALIINDIIEFYTHNQTANKNIFKVESGNIPIYMYRIDSNTRLVFTQPGDDVNEDILLVDILKK